MILVGRGRIRTADTKIFSLLHIRHYERLKSTNRHSIRTFLRPWLIVVFRSFHAKILSRRCRVVTYLWGPGAPRADSRFSRLEVPKSRVDPARAAKWTIVRAQSESQSGAG